MIETAPGPVGYRAKCTCGWVSDTFTRRPEAVAAEGEHWCDDLDVGTTWDYRVIRYYVGGVATFGIGEAYYEDGVLWGITEHGAKPSGVTLFELRSDLEKMMRALQRPPLDARVIPEHGEVE